MLRTKPSCCGDNGSSIVSPSTGFSSICSFIGDICSSNPVSLDSESPSLKLSDEIFSVRISSSMRSN